MSGLAVRSGPVAMVALTALAAAAMGGCERRLAGAPTTGAAAGRAATTAVRSSAASAGAHTSSAPAPTGNPRGAVAGTGASPSTSTPPAPPPTLPDAGALVPLPIEGFAEAVVALPRGGPWPRPVMIATHGNFDRPDWQCAEGQRITAGRAFVLCPRGQQRPDSPNAADRRYTYRDNHALEREIEAALVALRARFAAFADTGPMLYTGFSLGAITGAKIAARHPGRFPWLVLVEGGHDAWTPARAAAFAKGGGKRVIFACAQRSCELAAKRAARKLERAGVSTRVTLSPGLGHAYGGPISGQIMAALDWLLEGDDRWREVVAAAPAAAER